MDRLPRFDASVVSGTEQWRRSLTSDRETTDSLKKLEKWKVWLEGDLTQQINRIMHQRETFKSWNDIVEVAAAGSKSSGLFHTWVNYNYIQALTIAIRRMHDKDTRSMSLRCLLIDIKSHPSVLSRNWRESKLSDRGEYNLPELIDMEIVKLDNSSEQVKPYATKYVAHLDGDRESIERPNLGELHKAADLLYEVYHRWYELICQVVLLSPSRRPWEQIFTVPWITVPQAEVIVGRRKAEFGELERRLRRQALGESTIWRSQRPSDF